jgi:hypothetical protein
VQRKLLAGLIGVIAIVGLTAADCTPPSTPTTEYAADPSAGGYPDVETTGHDTPVGELTTLDVGCASVWITTDGVEKFTPGVGTELLFSGQTISGYHIVAGGVHVRPEITGALIEDSLIESSYDETTCPWPWNLVDDKGTDTIIEDSELDGESVVTAGALVNDTGTARRLNIHDVEDGMGVGSDTSIQGNFIHDLTSSNNPDPHFDGIVTTSTTGVVLHHNTVLVPEQTGAINIGNNDGPVSNVLIFQNLLAGGTYTIYVDDQFGAGTITNVDIAGNLFGPLGSEQDPEQETPFGHWFIRGSNNDPVNQPDAASMACDNRNDKTDALLPTFGDQSGC